MHFEEHGIYSIKIIDGILIIDATGPFNEELIKKYNNALETSINNLSGSDWSQVVSLHGLSLFTPEAESKLCESLLDRKNRGLKQVGLVCDCVEGKELILAQMSRCYENIGLRHECFDTVNEAKKWLTSHK